MSGSSLNTTFNTDSLSELPAELKALTLNRYVDPSPVNPAITNCLSDGLSETVSGSTVIVSASLFPVSLKIEKPVIGHPFSSGSCHPIVIEVLVVATLKG